jgi:hypothetical protein
LTVAIGPTSRSEAYDLDGRCQVEIPKFMWPEHIRFAEDLPAP